MKKEDKSWHFDPSKVDNSAINLGKIKIPETTKEFIKELCKSIPVEHGNSLFKDEIETYEDHEMAWKKLDHISQGYTQHNSELHSTRYFFEEAPDCLKEIMIQTKLKDAYIGILMLKPGNVIPWHYDAFALFKGSQTDNKKPNIERHLIFPFDWDWGHFFQIGNNIVGNWKSGQVYTWPYRRYHLGVNAGIQEYYMISITGRTNKK